VNLVCVPNDRHFPPFGDDHRMMVFGLCDRSDLVSARQGLREVLEFEDAFETLEAIHFRDLPLGDLCEAARARRSWTIALRGINCLTKSWMSVRHVH
jgi:hypothetical protein